jgi:hypothetical protein
MDTDQKQTAEWVRRPLFCDPPGVIHLFRNGFEFNDFLIQPRSRSVARNELTLAEY